MGRWLDKDSAVAGKSGIPQRQPGRNLTPGQETWGVEVTQDISDLVPSLLAGRKNDVAMIRTLHAASSIFPSIAIVPVRFAACAEGRGSFCDLVVA